MLPFRWMNNSEPMWTPSGHSPPVTPHQACNPQGQFCSGDHHQRSQAQTQAQINALQQQNALLNQQLTNQSLTHIQHLQQLVPHQHPQSTPPSIPNPQFTHPHQHPQSTPPPSPNPQPAHPPSNFPLPVQPEPTTSTLTPPSQPPNPNPEQMLNQMKQTLTPDLVAAVEKANERSSQLFHPSPPSTTTPPTYSQHRPTTSQLPPTAQASRLRPREPHRDDKRPIFLFLEAHGVVPALMIPAGTANQYRHHIVVERAQSLSCRCPLTVEVIAMTSTKMITPTTAPQDVHLVLLNLPILRHGYNQMGLRTTTTTVVIRSITVTNPLG